MRITLNGYYGRNNFGDELMLEILLKWFNENSINVNLLIRSNELEYDVRYPNVRVFLTKPNAFVDNFLTIIRSLKGSKLLLWGGGTCFSNEDGVHIRTFIIAKLLLKKIGFLGIGIGNVTGVNKIKTKLILQLSSIVTLRDKYSFEKCIRLVKGKGKLTADLSYLEFEQKSAEKGNYLLINLRKLDNYILPDNLKRYRALLKDEIIHLATKYNLNIVVNPIADIDVEENMVLYTTLKASCDNVSFENAKGTEMRTKILLGAHSVYTERLHAFILSASIGKIVFPLCYSSKFNYFIDEVKWQGTFININDVGRAEKGFLDSLGANEEMLIKLPKSSAEKNFIYLNQILNKK